VVAGVGWNTTGIEGSSVTSRQDTNKIENIEKIKSKVILYFIIWKIIELNCKFPSPALRVNYLLGKINKKNYFLIR
tara:strand:- start:453 stop:680 length:228 start_codon:yes stop_codon:yes gene_type:complete